MPTLKVNGMNCEHCKASVEKTVKAIPGIKDAHVDLNKNELHYEDTNAKTPVPIELIMGAIRDLGFVPVDLRP